MDVVNWFPEYKFCVTLRNVDLVHNVKKNRKSLFKPIPVGDRGYKVFLGFSFIAWVYLASCLGNLYVLSLFWDIYTCLAQTRG